MRLLTSLATSHCFLRTPLSFCFLFAEGCSPPDWTGYKGPVCGPCSALVKVRDNGGTCKAFCAKQGLACINAWDDTTSNQCSKDAQKLGCSHTFSSTKDAICECNSESTASTPCAVGDFVWVGEGSVQSATITSVLENTITVDWYHANVTRQTVDACSITRNGQACGNSCTTVHVPVCK